MARILRFGIKAGLFGGLVYYTRKVGVWDDSERTYQVAREAVAFGVPYLQPLVSRVEDELPVQIRDLPSTDDMSRTFTTYWNKGVTTSIKFISNIPCTLTCYANKGIKYVTKEIQRMKNESDPPRNQETS